MKKKLFTLLLTSLMVMVVLAGCSSGDDKPEGDASGKPADGEATYAIVLKNQSSDFWVKMKEGIEEKAKELGVKVDIQAAQSEEDTEGQLKIMESLVNGGYTAIGVAPLSPVNLIPSVVKATEKDIYVMNIDEKIDMDQLQAQGGAVIGFATTDNVGVGEKGANYIIENLEAGNEVAIIEGKAGNTSGEARKEGAQKAFKAADMKIVGSLPADWDRQKALDVASTFIQQNPNLKAIYCANDTMALGALQAVMMADKLGEIMVVGTDGDTEAVDSVEKGELSATVAQDPAEIGAKSLEEMVNAVKNKIDIDAKAEPKIVPVDSILIKK